MNLRVLLERAKHYDPDERFMALSDLLTALEAHEDSTQHQLQTDIRATLLQKLHDQSADVQAIAVKCLAAATAKFQLEEIIEIVKSLAVLAYSAEPALRDIFALGLRIIITATPDNYGHAVANELVKNTLEAFNAKLLDNSQIISCLDILKDTLFRFAKEVPDSHSKILKILTKFLQCDIESVRKKSISATGKVLHLNLN
jgi:hypothetical protein